MLLDKRARFLIKQDFVLRPRRGVGAALALASPDELDLMHVFGERVAAGTAERSLRLGDSIRLTQATQVTDKNMAVLLFRRTDANASNQHFENRRTRTLRPSDRAEDEDPAVSAHLFIDLTPRTAEANTYRAIIEEVPGLGVSYILPLLNMIARERPYLSMDRRGREVEARTHLEMAGLPSQTIGQALHGGGIDFIELVRPPELGGLDTGGLTPSPERLRFGVRRRDGIDPLGAITRIRNWANRQGWSDMRVQVVTGNSRRRTIEVARGQDAASILFIQSELRETRADLPVCSDTINDELVDHAHAMFATGDGWA